MQTVRSAIVMDKEQSQQEPLVKLKYRDTRITVLGTAHVSKTSADEVTTLLESGEYNAVAVELCRSRYQTLLSPDNFLNMDLAQVIRQHKVFRVVAILILGGYQQRIAESLGVEPGLEFKAALRIAEQRNLSLAIVDRDIGVTFKRLYAGLSWWRKLLLFNALLASLFYTEKVSSQEVERIKQGQTLEAMFEQLPMSVRNIKNILLDERDIYMSAKIKQFIDEHKPSSLLAIVGAAHLPGMVRQLEQPNDDVVAIIKDLEMLPARKKITRWLPWLVVLVILAGFAYGFSKETSVGFDLIIDWVLINGGLASVGALIAAAHPLTIITVFFAAPLTSINPTIGAGMVAATVELFLKKPRVSDFATLKKDTAKWSGWRRNRVAKIAMIFVLSSIGSAIGTYIGGFHIYTTLISL